MGGSALTDAGYYNLNPNGKENDWLGKFTGKDNVYSKEDFDIKLVKPKAGWHAYLSWFNRISKKLTSPTLCYTMFRDRAQQEIMKGHNVLWFCPSAGDTYYSKYNAILWQYTFCPIDLFNAQLDYSCGRHISLINLDNCL